MKDPKTLLRVSIIGTTLVALCCFTPVLVILLGVVGLSALTGYLDYVLLPALAIFIGLTIYAPTKTPSRCLLHPEIQWSKKMTEITVNGMTCTSCATHVKDALEKIPGVNAAVVSYPESRAQVMADRHRREPQPTAGRHRRIGLSRLDPGW